MKLLALSLRSLGRSSETRSARKFGAKKSGKTQPYFPSALDMPTNAPNLAIFDIPALFGLHVLNAVFLDYTSCPCLNGKGQETQKAPKIPGYPQQYQS